MARRLAVPEYVVVPGSEEERTESTDGEERSKTRTKPQLGEEETMECQMQAKALSDEEEEAQEMNLMLGQMTQLSQAGQQPPPVPPARMAAPAASLPPMYQPHANMVGLTQQWEYAVNPHGTNPAMRRDAYHASQQAGVFLGNSTSAVTVPAPSPYVGGNIEANLPPSDLNKKRPKKKKKKTSPPKKANDSEAGKGAAYTTEEMMELASIMEEILPIGKISFQRVEDRYNAVFPTRTRTADNLRRKFKNLVDCKKPTGSSDMPDHVRIAKRANYKIIDKSYASNGLASDDEEEVLGSDEEEEEEGADEEQEGEVEVEASSSAGQSSEVARGDPGGSSIVSSATPGKNSVLGTRNKKSDSSRTKKTGKGRGKGGQSSTGDLIEMMVWNQEERRLRDEARARSEDHRARRNQEMMMQMFSTAVTAFTSAFTGAATVSGDTFRTPPVRGSLNESSDDDSSSSDSSDTLSSVSSADSPHQKREKSRQKAKRKARRGNKKRKT